VRHHWLDLLGLQQALRLLLALPRLPRLARLARLPWLPRLPQQGWDCGGGPHLKQKLSGHIW
jgi:hypothetical protein